MIRSHLRASGARAALAAAVVITPCAFYVGCGSSNEDEVVASDSGTVEPVDAVAQTDGSVASADGEIQDSGVGALAFEMDPVMSAVDVGRYWARIQARGKPGAEPLSVWFEQKAEAASWDSAVKTPEGKVDANAAASTREEWLIGLAPGTTYHVRVCIRPDLGAAACGTPQSVVTKAASALSRIKIDPSNGRHLVLESGGQFVPWGNNYVFPSAGTPNETIEDAMYTSDGLARIDADLARLVNLSPPDGATNVIRMHLQLHTFMLDATTPDRKALAHYAKVVEHVEDHGLYVMVTGLNYFFPKDNPLWIAQQSEADHWNTQAVWWNAMAGALRQSPGVFAYDLMNEPYANGGTTDGGVSRWSTVPYDQYCTFGQNLDAGSHGTCFGQYVMNGLASRTPDEIATAWTHKMKEAIRTTAGAENDAKHMVTVGVGAFRLANSFNAAASVQQELEFLSPHLYPDSADNGLADINLAAALSLSGKPVIAGETFTFGPVRHLISQTCIDGTTQGWFGQYDGRKLGDACQAGRNVFACALFDEWYRVQSEFGPAIRGGGCPALVP